MCADNVKDEIDN